MTIVNMTFQSIFGKEFLSTTFMFANQLLAIFGMGDHVNLQSLFGLRLVRTIWTVQASVIGLVMLFKFLETHKFHWTFLAMMVELVVLLAMQNKVFHVVTFLVTTATIEVNPLQMRLQRSVSLEGHLARAKLAQKIHFWECLEVSKVWFKLEWRGVYRVI